MFLSLSLFSFSVMFLQLVVHCKFSVVLQLHADYLQLYCSYMSILLLITVQMHCKLQVILCNCTSKLTTFLATICTVVLYMYVGWETSFF